MEQLNNYADERLIVGCLYCGGAQDTREHVPSKVFLDSPLPGHLPVVGACRACNNGFSLDEEYFACLVECVIAGTTDPEKVGRERVAKALRHSPALRAKIDEAKYQQNGRTNFAPERVRVERVLVKLAKGHVAFELSQTCSNPPSKIWYAPLDSLTGEQRDAYETSQVVQTYGEIGSRGMQRLLVTQLTLQSSSGETSTIDLVINDWVEVQEGRYRYHAAEWGNKATIKIVISEYLACEVTWAL